MTDNQQITDASLIEKILEGDLNKFEILIRKYNSTLYRIAVSSGYNHIDAEKLMEKAYVDAYNNLGRIKEKNEFKKFLISRLLANRLPDEKKNISLKHILVATFSTECISLLLSGSEAIAAIS
jgi:DNA-directed RNA polymerase specialized sigma24 family protein